MKQGVKKVITKNSMNHAMDHIPIQVKMIGMIARPEEGGRWEFEVYGNVRYTRM
jgi:hypothetical protein